MPMPSPTCIRNMSNTINRSPQAELSAEGIAVCGGPTSFLDEKNGWPQVAVTSCQKAITANLQMADNLLCNAAAMILFHS